MRAQSPTSFSTQVPFFAAPATLSAPILAKRTAAQRDRQRKRMRWFLRGLSCAGGAPGLSPGPIEKEFIGAERTHVIPEETTYALEIGNSHVNCTLDAAIRQMQLEENIEHNKVDVPSEENVSEVATEHTECVDHSFQNQPVKYENGVELVKRESETRLTMPRYGEKLTRASSGNHTKVAGWDVDRDETHPLEFLEFEDLAELVLTNRAWISSRLLSNYIERWMRSQDRADDEEMPSPSWESEEEVYQQISKRF